ncbi:hypothetical protein SAMN05216421_1055 [Halopseudomonas xinjiangensis]|uniref:Uncharacterized protein n=1 Tax=Halopseudomonas xinjiangensis TaxID=487184 RepID=A0A1H1Q4Q3_9GAMM|nr:hypothetical protein [Halopseudomonas xinjiangensis]SDS18313.1 hypothetical protein SAMN05216421_1055 [Halopseudomonas xinjiangensis]
MKPRLIVILAGVAVASTLSYESMAQQPVDNPVIQDAGEKGGINLNRFRDDPGEPLDLMNTNDDDYDEVSAEDRERELDDRERRTYQRYDAEKTDLGPEAYRMDPSRRD